MSRIISRLVLLIAVMTLPQAAFAADVANGEKLAKRWCAACHVVSHGQAQRSTQAPPFSEIARKPGFDAGKLALYLLLPHPRMPDMNMSRAEATDAKIDSRAGSIR